jgi:hypothetical protein
MNRSTVRSFIAVSASTIVLLSASPLAASAQTAPPTTVDQARNVDIIFGDGDEGPIYIGPVPAPSRPNSAVLLPGDVLFGDADQGAIATGPTSVPAAVLPAEMAAPQPAQDIMFADDEAGGVPVDLSAFRGRSNISATELAGGQPLIAQDIAGAREFGVDD